MSVLDRATAARLSAASLRIEGLVPSPEAEEIAQAWVDGQLDNSDLIEAEQRILAGEPIGSPARVAEAA